MHLHAFKTKLCASMANKRWCPLFIRKFENVLNSASSEKRINCCCVWLREAAYMYFEFMRARASLLLELASVLCQSTLVLHYFFFFKKKVIASMCNFQLLFAMLMFSTLIFIDSFAISCWSTYENASYMSCINSRNSMLTFKWQAVDSLRWTRSKPEARVKKVGPVWNWFVFSSGSRASSPCHREKTQQSWNLLKVSSIRYVPN